VLSGRKLPTDCLNKIVVGKSNGDAISAAGRLQAAKTTPSPFSVCEHREHTSKRLHADGREMSM
jgi:hypothetical protein